MDVLPPRTGELLGDSADRRVELLCEDGALHATWSRFGPGRDGADLHVHYRHSDLFYVLEGERYLNFHAPGSGFAGYMRARRDGLPASTDQASFDQEDPPADGGRPPGAASIGEATLVADEIAIDELRLEPGAALHAPAARRLLCLYVLEGTLALTDDVQAGPGTWVRDPLPTLACAGSEPVRLLQIHV